MSTPPPPAEHVAVVPGRDGDGGHVFAVLVKRTYHLRAGGALRRAEAARALAVVDEYHAPGNPERCTVQHESDLVPFKPATDVVLVGRGYAPGGAPAEQMDVELRVGNHRKAVRVTGDRVCAWREGLPPLFSDPRPFTTMELRYERAYGGSDEKSNPDSPFFYPRNLLGRGVALRNVPDAVHGLPLPNLEYAGDPLTPERVVIGDPDAWNDQPLPAGLAWYPKTAYPRCSFVGVVPGTMDPDTVMREERLGLVPERQVALFRQRRLPTFDIRFASGASPGLAVPYLRGDEPVRLTGLTPEGDLAFALPGDVPRLTLDTGTGEEALAPVLHTVCIRTDDGEVDLVWRGARPYPGIDWLPELRRLDARVYG